MWQKYEDVPAWTVLSDAINGIVKNSPNDNYGAPSAVMRSVSTPVNASKDGSMVEFGFIHEC
jgi:hypothetical protein